MRIGLFSNNNHINFTLARYLRDKGHDVVMHLLNEHEHFLPEHDTFDSRDLEKVTKLNWFEIGHWKMKSKNIRQVTDKFDFLIANDLVPAYLYKAGVKLDLMYPHGTDISYKADFKYKPHVSLKGQVGTFWEKYCQRQGLKQTGVIAMPYYDEYYEAHLKRHQIIRNRSFDSVPMVYAPQYEKRSYFEQCEQDENYKIVREIRTKCDLLICQQGRQENTNKTSIHYKGNEKLFGAFKRLLETGAKAHLVLFEYGTDVPNSKKIIHELQVGEHVTWIPKIPRKKLMAIISMADVGVGILAPGSFITYGSLNECLVMQIPIIHHLDPATLKHQDMPDIYPYLNANTESEVFEALLRVSKNKEHYKKLAAKGKEWYRTRIVENSLGNIDNMIVKKEKQINKSKTNH